jgi:hypothetical protein
MKDLELQKRSYVVKPFAMINIISFALCVAITFTVYCNIISEAELFIIQLLLIFNCFFILHLIFSSSSHQKYTVVNKALILMIMIPVLPHLMVNIIFSSRPLLVYPVEWRDSMLASTIEAASYAIPLFFANVIVIFSRVKKPWSFKLVSSKRSIIFFIFLFQCLIYSLFSTFGHDASLIRGEYAAYESINFLSINSWNAMSIIALIFTGCTLNRNSRVQCYMFGFAVIVAVFIGSLFYGRRADIFGLLLVLIALASTKKLKIGKIIFFIFSSILIFLLFSLLAILRDFGISSSGLADSLMANNALLDQLLSNGYIIPSLTDFFSTMPMVLAYTKWDGGNLYLGMTYLHALSSILPEVIFPFRLQDSATTFIQKNYMIFNGGMFLPAETYFNFGILGVVIFAMFLANISNHLNIIKSTTVETTFIEKYNNAIVLSIIDGFSRYVLYGTSNFTKHIFLILFIIAFTNIAAYLFQKKKSSLV